MKRYSIVLLALASAVLMTRDSTVVVAQQGPEEIPFDSVPNFFKLPEGLYFGEGAGVAVNRAGHIFVYTRKGSGGGHIIAPQAASVYEFNHDGTFVREIKDLYSMAWAHAIRFDRDDNMWLVDNGSDTVVRLDPQRRVQLVLGRRRESVASTEVRPPVPAGTPTPAARDGIFNEPTDVTWDPQGDIFVSDGYKNMEVAKFDKEGRWVKRIGKGNGAETGNGPGEFASPHGIAADEKGNIYVADRGNARIQVFDSDLKFLRAIRLNVPAPANATITNTAKPTIAAGQVPPVMGGTFVPGAPWALCITPGPNQVLFTADAYPGRLYKLSLDGKVLGYLGKNGKQLKEFNWIHGIACPNENEVYVSELLTWRVQKLVLHPKTTTN